MFVAFRRQDFVANFETRLAKGAQLSTLSVQIH